MSELSTFLLVRIAEDEEAARRSGSTLLMANLDAVGRYGTAEHTTFLHHERWEPRRVLAECQAKRRIIELHRVRPDMPDVCNTCLYGRGTEPNIWCETLEALALPYAGHEGFKEEWAL